MILKDYTGIETAEDVKDRAKAELQLNRKPHLDPFTAFIVRDIDYVEWQDPRHLNIGSCHIWLWNVNPNTGYPMQFGYPADGTNIRKSLYVRREVNQTPDHLDTRHRCRNKRCVNRLHLLSGTRQQNIRDIGNEIDTGTRSPYRNRKITKKDCHEIQRRFKAGESVEILAISYKVKSNTVRRHLHIYGMDCLHTRIC